MGHIRLSDISITFGERELLRSVGFSMDKTSRIALTGANGSGKTTLMKVLAGAIPPDSGSRILQREVRISHLPQSGIRHTGESLEQECLKAFTYLDTIQQKKELLESRLATLKDESEDFTHLLEEQHRLEETLEEKGYYMRHQEILKVLTGLGFDPADLPRDTSEFSGGWQMRIALAKVLLEKPELLLLDEPTNYLDLEAREWLQSWILTFTGGILLVSHDRHFLDTTTNETVEIFSGSLKRYRGNYTAYEKKRGEELATLLASYEKQQAEIKKTEEFISRFRYNASKARLVQSRIRWLEKQEPILIPETLKKIHIIFPKPPHCGRKVVEAEDLSKQYDDHLVFEKASFSVDRGEKVVLAGVNGAGKSTLLRILCGREKCSTGSITYGKDVTIAYFSQDVDEIFTSDVSVLEELEKDSPSHLIPSLKNMLGAFLFRGDDVYKPVSVLSGGEKSRFALLKILLHPANLLLLDEPTNHLDMHSKDVLLEALRQFSGTIMFVSHDRYFIEGLATKVVELKNRALTMYPGDYGYYLWKLEQAAEFLPESIPKERPERAGRLKREEEKKARNRQKKLKQEEADCIHTIETLEQQKGEQEKKLHIQENYSDPEKAAKIEAEIKKIDEELDNLHAQWEKVISQLEAEQV